jgi:two-component system, sporulation sensor kinase E
MGLRIKSLIARFLYRLSFVSKPAGTQKFTERKQLEAELEKQKRFLKSLMDAIPDLIFYKDMTSRYIGCNRAFAENFIGKQEEDIIGKFDLDFVKDLEIAKFFRQKDLEMFEAGETRVNEESITLANGSVVDLETAKNPFYDEKGQIAGIIGVSRDITERKRFESQLRERELWLNLATSSAQIGLWDWSISSGKAEYNEQWAAINGYMLEELTPLSVDTWRGLTHPEDLRKMDELLEKYLSCELEYYECELRMKHKRGDWVWVLSRGKVIEWDEDKKPVRMAGTHIDITRQKQVEEALRAERSLFMGGVTIVFLWKNIEGWPVEYVSPNVYKILGYTVEEILSGKFSYMSIIHPDDFERVVEEVLMYTNSRTDSFEQVYRIITASGETRWVLDFTVVKLNLSGEVTHYHGYMNDITEHKLIESRMAQLDRLNLVGEVAAGIGHEVRNPMTTVRGYLQLFQNKAEFAKYHDQFGTMIEELDRANSIITEFLSLAKNKSVEKKNGNLNNVIQDLFPILQAEAFQQGHQLQVEIGEIPDSIFDEKQIRQLILNMVRNGLDAIESSGLVIIKTYSENGNIILAIQDNGLGIPEEVLDKLGTPFVTTKEYGTGLGLSICYRIADRHGASIEVSTSSEGTTFSIIFYPDSHPLKSQGTVR